MMSINRIHKLRQVRADETEWETGRNHRGEQRSRAARQVERSIDHMLRHLNEPLRVSMLSSIAGFSNSYFFALFKSATGYAPKEFFIRLKMRRACALLTRPGVRIKEVAAALGYGDEFYFSRLFKSVTGIAPRDYRQQMRDLGPSTATHQAGAYPQEEGSREGSSVNSVGLMSRVLA